MDIGIEQEDKRSMNKVLDLIYDLQHDDYGIDIIINGNSFNKMSTAGALMHLLFRFESMINKSKESNQNVSCHKCEKCDELISKIIRKIEQEVSHGR